MRISTLILAVLACAEVWDAHVGLGRAFGCCSTRVRHVQAGTQVGGVRFNRIGQR